MTATPEGKQKPESEKGKRTKRVKMRQHVRPFLTSQPEVAWTNGIFNRCYLVYKERDRGVQVDRAHSLNTTLGM